jgi:hypothetical protein
MSKKLMAPVKSAMHVIKGLIDVRQPISHDGTSRGIAHAEASASMLARMTILACFIASYPK